MEEPDIIKINQVAKILPKFVKKKSEQKTV